MLPAIKIMDHNSNGNWIEFYEVQSENRPGVAYVVAKSCKGIWGCSCPAWIYQRGQHGDCKTYPTCAEPDRTQYSTFNLRQANIDT